MPRIQVHLLPTLFAPEELSGNIAVVIDILRASSTIIHALANGAEKVIPCGEVPHAWQIAAQLPMESRLLGGERHGTAISGFDLDNSPLKYTPEIVGGKTLIFTTTNGTRAMERCRAASEIYFGAFVNRQAVVRRLRESDRTIHLVCAGTDGGVSVEDVLFAGSVVQGYLEGGNQSPMLDDETQLALEFWKARGSNPENLLMALRESRGGRNLVELGFDDDIERCACLDLFDLVPRWNVAQAALTNT